MRWICSSSRLPTRARPTSVLEAMALETPVVATDVGGTAELVTHLREGLIVPPGDAGALRRRCRPCSPIRRPRPPGWRPPGSAWRRTCRSSPACARSKRIYRELAVARETVMKDLLKRVAFAVATVAVSPALLSFFVRSQVLGRDRALEGSTQALGLVPGITGHYLRRAFLARTLASCHWTATVEFGTLFSSAGARIDENVYVGPRCHLGLVHLERDVLVGAGVHITSGAATHGTEDVASRSGIRSARRRWSRSALARGLAASPWSWPTWGTTASWAQVRS